MNQSEPSIPTPKRTSTLKWLLVILLIVLLCSGGYWCYRNYFHTSVRPFSIPSSIYKTFTQPFFQVTDKTDQLIPSDYNQTPPSQHSDQNGTSITYMENNGGPKTIIIAQSKINSCESEISMYENLSKPSGHFKELKKFDYMNKSGITYEFAGSNDWPRYNNILFFSHDNGCVEIRISDTELLNSDKLIEILKSLDFSNQ